MTINLKDYDPALMQGANIDISLADVTVDDLTVGDDASIGGDLTVTSTATVSGATTLESTLAVTGTATHTGVLSVLVGTDATTLIFSQSGSNPATIASIVGSTAYTGWMRCSVAGTLRYIPFFA